MARHEINPVLFDVAAWRLQQQAEKQAFVRRGLKCNLKPSPSSQVVQLEIFVGGLEQGGLIYRFMLRDTNYGA